MRRTGFVVVGKRGSVKKPVQRQIPHLITINKANPVAPSQHEFELSQVSVTGSAVKPVRLPSLPSLPGSDLTRSAPIVTKGVNDSDLDGFLQRCSSMELHQAMESFFSFHFNAKVCIYWEEIPDIQMLYSMTLNQLVSHSQALSGFCFVSRTIVRIPNAVSHQAYESSIDGKLCSAGCPALMIPLWDSRNSLTGILEIVRPPNGQEFCEGDEEFADWFARKFKLLSNWLIPPVPLEGLTLDIMKLMRNDQFVAQVLSRVSSYFNCRTCDIWRLDKVSHKVTKYARDKMMVDQSLTGIAGDSLSRESTVYCTLNKHHASYNAEVDGSLEEAVLAVPVKERNDELVYAVVLRGPTKGIFSPADEYTLKRVAPLVLLALENSETYQAVDDQFQSSRIEREGLAVLLEIVEVLSSQLDAENLTEIIMEKGRSLIHADRCSLFLLNETRDRLITTLHQGLEHDINIPTSTGIVGKTVTEGKAFNVVDAYETEFFDSSVDLATGYRTRSVLSVPIYNNRGEIIGATEMVNKIDNKPFTQWDTSLIQIFNVFCGISLENAKLYSDSVELSNQLRLFFDVAVDMSKSEDSQRMLGDMIRSAVKGIGAEKSSIFIYDEGKNSLSILITDIDNHPRSMALDKGIAGSCATTRRVIVENDPYHNPAFDRSIDQVTDFKTRSVLTAPLVSSNGELIGVVEVVNKIKGSFGERDVQLISAFGTFASVILEKAKLKDIAELGDGEIELHKWIGETERNDTKTIPVLLQLTPEQIEQVCRLDCFAVDFKGIGHFKEQFYLFSRFHLLETYNITNEQFFRFIFTISGTYNQVPYHNWTHACDVTQYISYEIMTANLDQVFTSFELFGLLTASVCHDANHGGLNNVFNVKAETPLGILFKDQSVMEMHHLTIAIPIILKDEINLFHALSPEDTKKMWNLFIQLILATDMAHHFALVKSAQTWCDEGKFDINDPEHRLVALKLVLKVADISNVSRPFALADKWCDILNNEFFRQGDLEKSSGIGLTSPLNDRETSNKSKSQIGFYNFICLPLYGVLARIFPPLQVNVESVKSNLEVWKSMAAAAAPPPSN